MIAVCIATYNQQAYIAQAIKSVLQQECDEPIHIYIGDDASTDGTSAICMQYSTVDKRITHIKREQNLGVTRNTTALLRQILADGCDYVAILDGDDYWVHPRKLQLEIDYLRHHPECGIVHTAAYRELDGVLFEEPNVGIPTGDISHNYNQHGPRSANCTVMFRTALIHMRDLDEIDANQFPMLDYPLYGVFAQYTHFGFLQDYTAVWRSHLSISQPRYLYQRVIYQYHYVRCWRWLHQRYPDSIAYSHLHGLVWLLFRCMDDDLQTKIGLLMQRFSIKK